MMEVLPYVAAFVVGGLFASVCVTVAILVADAKSDSYHALKDLAETTAELVLGHLDEVAYRERRR